MRKKPEEKKIFEDKDETPVTLHVKPASKTLNLKDVEGDSTNMRLKAYQLMRMKNPKKTMNDNLLTNNNSKDYRMKMHSTNFENNEIDEKANENTLSEEMKSKLFVLNSFQEMLQDKDKKFQMDINKDQQFQSNQLTHKVKIDICPHYRMGINSDARISFCFHKDEKWIAYLCHNLVIIECFDKDRDRQQTVLKDSNSYLDSLKISENQNILYSYSKLRKDQQFPQLYFWDVKKGFKLINKCVLKHNEIKDVEISPQNNFCSIISILI